MSSIIRGAALAMAMALSGTAPAALAQEASSEAQPARDLAQEERNRQIVLEMYDRIFNKHDLTAAEEFIAEDYIQHNPSVPNGRAPFLAFFGPYFEANPNLRARIVRSVAEGDLVWIHVHSTNGDDDRGRAIVDIFRVADGKVVEHWDVIQAVPETAANENTMF